MLQVSYVSRVGLATTLVMFGLLTTGKLRGRSPVFIILRNWATSNHKILLDQLHNKKHGMGICGAF